MCGTRTEDPLVHVINHPLVQHKLTLMRRKDANTSSFPTLLNELSMLMAYEVTRDMPTHEVEIETPLEKMSAGTGILDGMLTVVPWSIRCGPPATPPLPRLRASRPRTPNQSSSCAC